MSRAMDRGRMLPGGTLCLRNRSHQVAGTAPDEPQCLTDDTPPCTSLWSTRDLPQPGAGQTHLSWLCPHTPPCPVTLPVLLPFPIRL